ncbi:MAG: tyrosine-type recombinase/integrase, partial [Gemmatimonadaceae bacterium]
FHKPEPGDRREGFFESGDFAALLLELPADVAGLVRFLRFTGWRRGEGTGLLWSQVDFDDPDFQVEDREPAPGLNACVRIGGSQTKARDAREFPFAEAPELRDLLLARWRARNGLRVFHRNGRPIGDFRKVWMTACTKAGLEGRLIHDLRRSAARDFRRAGVSESQIMLLCGWKTATMFRRYDINSPADLRHAVAQRFNGTTTANIPVDAAMVR